MVPPLRQKTAIAKERRTRQSAAAPFTLSRITSVEQGVVSDRFPLPGARPYPSGRKLVMISGRLVFSYCAATGHRVPVIGAGTSNCIPEAPRMGVAVVSESDILSTVCSGKASLYSRQLTIGVLNPSLQPRRFRFGTSICGRFVTAFNRPLPCEGSGRVSTLTRREHYSHRNTRRNSRQSQPFVHLPSLPFGTSI